MSEIRIVVAEHIDTKLFDAKRARSQRPRTWWTKVPWVTFCIGLTLIICCILEWGYDIPRGNIQRWNAFLTMLFNCGGVWLHFLPNLILCLVFGSIIESIIGSTYMVLVVMLSYTASVLYKLVMYEWVIQPVDERGYGFSIMAYQWFSISSASLFLHYWWRPFKKWKEQKALDKAPKQFGTWYWWMLGISLLLGGGWIPHFIIMALAAQFYPRDPDNHAHTCAVIMGYGVSAIIAVLLWCQNRCQKQDDVEESQDTKQVEMTRTDC